MSVPGAHGEPVEVDRTGDDPVEVRLGAGDVLRGIEDVVVGMRLGGIRHATVPPRLGYGARGVPGRVPPDRALLLLVDLVAIVSQLRGS